MRPAAEFAARADLYRAPESAPAAARLIERCGEALAREWRALAERASEPCSFAEHWFVAASLAHLKSKRDIRLVEARSRGRLIGVMPVAIEAPYGRTPVPFVQNWCHPHLFLGTPLVEAGAETAFWTAAIEALDDSDWAPNFLHLRGLVEGGPVHRGLVEAAEALGRVCAIVYGEERALLAAGRSPRDYYTQAVRPKKRKELRRLRVRLAELGPVEIRTLEEGAELGAWCDSFLAMERSGWKGEAGSALACTPGTDAFFRDAVAGAWEEGRLRFLRMDVAGRPVAMLVAFLALPGAFAFKTAFDEEFARFSPGVLIQTANLDILDDPAFGWMDSCAAADHPMIDSLWTERRTVVRTTVRLKGLRRGAVFAACRALENGAAACRSIAARVRA